MRDKRTGEDRPHVSEEDEDLMVLSTFLDQDDYWPWSVDELIRDRGDGDEVAVVDAINRLHRGGLIHRTQDDLIFPTRTAIYRATLRE
jgi:hypothetical protein